MAIPFLSGIKISTAFSSSPSDSIFLYTSGNNTPGGGSEIIFGTSTSATTAHYNAKVAGVRSSLDNGSSDLQFLTTHVSDSIASSTKMTIKSTGKIGIGTLTPESKLTIKSDPGNTNQPTRITNNSTDSHTGLFLNGTGNAVNEKYGLQFGNYNEYSIGGIFGVMDSTSASTSGDITIDFGNGTAGGALVEKVRFTHEGHVGIGTATPSQKLTIREDSSTTYSTGDAGTNKGDFVLQNNNQTNDNFNRISFQTTSNNNQTGDLLDAARITAVYPDHAGGNPSGELAFETKADAGYMREAMRIDRDGKIGIGTDSPTYKLEIAEDTDGTVNLLMLRNSDSTYAQTWAFQSDTNKDLVITGSSGAGGFKFVPGSRGSNFTGDILTDTDSSSDIGKTDARWANLWVDNINGGTPVTGGPFLPIAAGSGNPLTGSLYFNNSVRSIVWPHTSGQSSSRSWAFIGEQGSYGKFELRRSDAADDTPDTTVLEFDLNGKATFAEGITAGGNVQITGDTASPHSDNAFLVLRGSDGSNALRVQNSGEVVVQNNYLYASGAGVSLYVQAGAVFRGSIQNDGGNVTIGDNLDVNGNLQVLAKGSQLGSSGYYVNSTFKDVADNCGVILGHDDTANGVGAIAGINELAFLTYGSAWTQALLLDSSQNATFAGSVTANSFIKSGGTSSQYLMADGSVSTGVASHNHNDLYYTETEIDNNFYGKVAIDAKFTSSNGTEDEWKFTLGDESNLTGNKWYKVAQINQGSGGLHIKGSFSNHVESFGTQHIDLLLQGREGNDSAEIEINGTVNVIHNAGSGTDKVGIRVVESDNTSSQYYHYYDVYMRTTRYTQAKFHLTKFGTTSFYTSKPSVTSEPAPVSGGSVELDTSTLDPGNHIIVDSAVKSTIADSNGNATFAGDVTISNASPALNLTDTDNSSNIALSSVGGALIVNSTSDQVYQIGGTEYFRIATTGATFAGDVTIGDDLSVPKIRLEDINSTVGSLFKIYAWDDELQFTKRNLSTEAHTGTLLALNYSDNSATFAGTIGSGNINISDGTPVLTLTDTSSSATATLTLDGVNLTLQNNGTDGDFTIIGKDGSNNINLLSFDTSEGGNATFSGSVTATSFSGDGSNLTNLPTQTDSTKLPLAGGTMTGHTLHGNNVMDRYGSSSEFSIYHNGTDGYLQCEVGDLICDVAGEVILDSGTAEIHLKASGAIFGKFFRSGGNFYINSPVSDADIYFSGNDGGTAINALRLDMSDSGWAHFNSGISVGNSSATSTFAGSVTIGGNLTVEGTTTILDTQTVEVKDNILQLNTTQGTPNTATATTSGISIYRGVDGNGNAIDQASFIFDDSDDTWDLTNNLSLTTGSSLYLNGTTGLRLLHDGSNALFINQTAGDFKIQNSASNKDIIFRGLDGSSTIDALTLDMSENGNATFSGSVTTPAISINGTNSLIKYGASNDIDSTTATISNIGKSDYTAVFFDYVIKKGTNVRAGVIYACHDGTNVEYAETSTVDLGDTSDVTLFVDIDSNNMMLKATTTSNDWSVKSLIRAI